MYKILLLTGVLTASLHGADILKTGFESSEGYVLGSLIGQNGWSETVQPIGTVEDTVVHFGSQAIAFDATGISGQALAVTGLSYDSAGNPASIVIVSDYFRVSADSADDIFDAIALFGSSGFIDQFGYFNGSASLGSNSMAINGTSWNHFELVLDFTKQVDCGYVNGAWLAATRFPVPIPAWGHWQSASTPR